MRTSIRRNSPDAHFIENLTQRTVSPRELDVTREKTWYGQELVRQDSHLVPFGVNLVHGANSLRAVRQMDWWLGPQ